MRVNVSNVKVRNKKKYLLIKKESSRKMHLCDKLGAIN